MSMSKSLATVRRTGVPKRDEMRLRCTVTAPTIMAHLQLWTQGQMSQRRAVEKYWFGEEMMVAEGTMRSYARETSSAAEAEFFCACYATLKRRSSTVIPPAR
jgi:hypothetical protein